MVADQPCEYCGKLFVAVANHYPHCPVKKITDEANAQIASGENIHKAGKPQILEVRESATEKIPPDRFWAWTEGLGLQISIVIDSFTGIQVELRNLIKIVEELRNNAGNSFTTRTEILQQLVALNAGMADLIEIAQSGKITDEDRIKELEKKKIGKVDPGFKLVPAGNVNHKPVSQTQDEADAQNYEETQISQDNGSDVVVSYTTDKTLPEHTRKLKATITIATEKALQLQFPNGKEAWIPKSTIKSTTDEKNKGDGATAQVFIIDSWVLKKNAVIGKDE